MKDEVVTGGAAQVLPGVRRVTAPNAGVMTGPGTNTYLIGTSSVAVIDPGPRIDEHIEKIVAESPGPIEQVLVTHTHPDHSPAAMRLAELSGAELTGIPAPDGKHQDKTFVPDRIPADGDRLEAGETELLAIHTPGHASNHLCFLHTGHNLLFTGDHIMNGSTVVIDPPDGNMAHYIDSLEKLKSFRIDAIAPAHGGLMHEPGKVIDWIIEHRLEREAKVATALAGHPGSTPTELVPHAYREVDSRLYRLAERSLLAHLGKLEHDGRATVTDGRWTLHEE